MYLPRFRYRNIVWNSEQECYDSPEATVSRRDLKLHTPLGRQFYPLQKTLQCVFIAPRVTETGAIPPVRLSPDRAGCPSSFITFRKRVR